jgi:DNA-binding NarL/FixJ family response regulator
MDERPIKVLIADDDDRFLASLRELIEQQPELTVVAAATNGYDAIELAGALEPDAAVVDLHMPQLDGVGAVERLRRNHPALCLIVVTGDPDPIMHQAAVDAGADAVLEKREFAQGLIARLRSTRPT